MYAPWRFKQNVKQYLHTRRRIHTQTQTDIYIYITLLTGHGACPQNILLAKRPYESTATIYLRDHVGVRLCGPTGGPSPMIPRSGGPVFHRPGPGAAAKPGVSAALRRGLPTQNHLPVRKAPPMYIFNLTLISERRLSSLTANDKPD